MFLDPCLLYLLPIEGHDSLCHQQTKGKRLLE